MKREIKRLAWNAQGAGVGLCVGRQEIRTAGTLCCVKPDLDLCGAT